MSELERQLKEKQTEVKLLASELEATKLSIDKQYQHILEDYKSKLQARDDRYERVPSPVTRPWGAAQKQWACCTG